MKANKRFFSFSFILNLILGLIGFGILAIVGAVSAKSIIGLVICAVIFSVIAFAVNIFIVHRSKLKSVYFIFGTVVNIVFFLAPSLLVWFL